MRLKPCKMQEPAVGNTSFMTVVSDASPGPIGKDEPGGFWLVDELLRVTFALMKRQSMRELCEKI